MIRPPDPPLRSGDLVLRPWADDDAPSLAAAWADPEVRRWTGVPERCDLAAARRWISGDDRRTAAGRSLDLVVIRDGAVAGEVGLTAFDAARTTAELGWWTAPAHRGRGVASIAVGLVARWALHEVGLRSVTARCHRDNGAAAAVARHAGLQPLDVGQAVITFGMATAG